MYNHLRYFKVERRPFKKEHRNKIKSKRDGQTSLFFKISQTYQKEILKRPRLFVFQKHIKKSTCKLRRFSIHENYIKKVHPNDIDYSPIEITSKKHVKMSWKIVDIDVST